MNYIYNNKEEMNKLLNRFCRYVKIWSESDGKAADRGVFPSTERQWDIAKVLVKELRNLGTRNVYLTDNCYVVAKIDSNIIDPQERAKYPSILLMAHMDTVDEVSGENVKPVISILSAKESPTGQDDTIVRSDGTTLLGADDKAGVSAIMAAVEYLMNHYEDENLKHGPIEVMFSPDEETGHGMDKVPLNILKSECAYTVDGGSEGELEAECFNAWSCTVCFTGKACHTGDAKAGGMINAVTLAGNFAAELPREMTPETTEGYEGFIAPMEISGTIESARVDMLLRSFDVDEIEKEKEIIKAAAKKVTEKFGGTFELGFRQQYLNMKQKMDEHPEVVARLEKAYEAAGVKVVKKPIRGGTDGSRLTELGIPTPNIFTGGHEFHSRNEWLSLNQCAKAADVLINLLTSK
ncbi:MAG: tripeptide aminopeptidase PepT [Treponema sp.]|nr:tripeptide aminopeptidase PepT [Treponema sp.]